MKAHIQCFYFSGLTFSNLDDDKKQNKNENSENIESDHWAASFAVSVGEVWKWF